MSDFSRYPGKSELTLSEFETFLNDLKFIDWKPSLIVVHHTWQPTLDQWHGVKSLDAMERFYQTSKGWHHGPHFYVSDQHWYVFNTPTERGVHAISYNSDSYGIEVVHNGDVAPFSGAQAELLYSGLSLVFNKLGLDPQLDLRFHREDVLSKKTCPGLKVTKADVINGILNRVAHSQHQENNPSVSISLDGEKLNFTGERVDGITFAPIRALSEALGATVEYRPGLHPFIAVKKGDQTLDLSGEIEMNADGHAYAQLRGIAEDLGYTVTSDAAGVHIKSA